MPDAAGPSGGASSGGVSGGSGGAASGGAPASSGGAPASTGGAPAGSGGASSTGGRGGGGVSGGSGGRGTGGTAGSAANGGSTGTAGTSGFGLGGPSRCATAGVKFCEDFEAGPASIANGNGTWTITRNGDTTMVVDTVRAARGSNALHIKTTAGDFAYIKETKSFPATNNILFGRMYVYFEDDITTDGHFSLAEGAGTGTPGVSRFGGQYKVFGVGSDLGPSGDWTDKDDMNAATMRKVPSKTWICAEFEFKGDTHEFRVWWDDAERTALRTGPSRHANFVMPTFNSLWFGWWMYNIKEPQELWIDEIAVDYQPIGCAK